MGWRLPEELGEDWEQGKREGLLRRWDREGPLRGWDREGPLKGWDREGPLRGGTECPG